MPRLQIKSEPTYSLWLFLLCMHGFALYIILFNDLNNMIQQGAVLAIFLSLIYSYWQYYAAQRPTRIIAAWCQGEDWIIELTDQSQHLVKLESYSFNSQLLTILHFRTVKTAKHYCWVLGFESLSQSSRIELSRYWS